MLANEGRLSDVIPRRFGGSRDAGGRRRFGHAGRDHHPPSWGKADAWKLCATGQKRAAALAATYLGNGTEPSLFNYGERPDAFFAITLHTLELAAPAAEAWGLPIVLWSVVPEPDMSTRATVAALNLRTQEAVADLMQNPRWQNKTVVMVWEHHHIADAALDSEYPEAVTLRTLLHLDTFPDVPATWSGDNYDYFWVVEMNTATAMPTGVRIVKQEYPANSGVPSNAWGEPDGLGAESGCEK